MSDDSVALELAFPSCRLYAYKEGEKKEKDHVGCLLHGSLLDFFVFVLKYICVIVVLHTLLISNLCLNPLVRLDLGQFLIAAILDPVQLVSSYILVRARPSRGKFIFPVSRQLGDDWAGTDRKEFQAFIGKLIFATVTKSNKEPVREMFDAKPGRSRSFFYLTMTAFRFKSLIALIRFGDNATRPEREARDKNGRPTNLIAPIDQLFRIFLKNIQESRRALITCQVVSND